MSKFKKVEKWKVVAAKAWHEQREAHPDNNINWKRIVKTVEEQVPKTFVGCPNPERKLFDFFKRNPKLIEEILREEVTHDELPPAVPRERIATTAHVDDEDKDVETEQEVTSSADITEFKNNKDGSITISAEIVADADSEKLMNEDNLLTKLGYDPLVWEIVSSSCRKGEWDAQIKGGDIKKLYSYRVNANVKKREGSICQTALLDAMIAELNKSDRLVRHEPIYVAGENIAIVSIADLHLGKLAWYKECGGNYDYKICRERYFYIINRAITYLKQIKNLEKIVFFWSQDFFHYDSLRITTTAGTPQDTDVRWQKLFQVGCQMLVDGIELLRDELNVPIHTFYTRSNHDMQVSYYAVNYLYAWFHKDQRVEVDNEPIGRKYIEYGVNLMGFGHGDEEKKRIHTLMQIEEREAWGRTTSHEYFLGHFHKQMVYYPGVNDEGGVTVRYLASPTETDNWHYTEGYIGSMKAAQVFIRNKYEGPTDEHTINICE